MRFLLVKQLLAKRSFLLTLSFLCLQTFVHAQDNCELRKSQDGILVYACKVSDSNIKSIRADFTISTSLSILVGHLLNIEDYVHWQYRMVESRTLKRISEKESIFTSEIGAPWPVSNRDLVLHLIITQNPKTKEVIITVNSVPEYSPSRKGVVRVPMSEGKWVFTPNGKGQVKVTYTFLVDPGGSIPSWLVNLTIAEGPYQTFKALIDRVNKGVKVPPAPFIID